MKYKLLRFFLLCVLAMLGGVVHADYYQKVTSTADLTDGEYLIVYKEGSVAFNGGLTTLDAVGNTIAVVFDKENISSSTGVNAATFTFIKTTSGYSIKSASGFYIGQTSNANGLLSNSTTTYANTITFDTDGNANIVSGEAYLRYNPSTNQTRFRYFKSSSYTNQNAIQLYKKMVEAGDTRPSTKLTITVPVTTGYVNGSANVPSVKVMAGDTEVENPEINWESDKTEVATVADGVISFLAEGTANIKAYYAGNDSYKPSSASFTLTVSKNVTSIVLSEDYATTGFVGKNIDLPTVTVMSGDNAIGGATVTWSSSNEGIATIEDGKIKLIEEGTTDITCTYAGDNVYAASTATYQLTADYSDEIDNPYSFTFTKNVFDADNKTKNLRGAKWTVATDTGYFGYDTQNNKGHQFGSGNNPAATLTLSTSDIPGTITCVKINTSGASGISATVGVTVGETALHCGDNATVSLTKDPTDYEFTGSASGEIKISYVQTSSKAIYIKSIEVTYTIPEEPAGFRDIKVNLTDETWSTKINSSGAASTVYLTVDKDGVIGTTENAKDAAATLTGYWHGTTYGWQKFAASVPVEGCVKITYGMNDYGGDVIVTNSNNDEVAKLNNKNATGKWSATNPDQRIAVAYYRSTDATTLNFSQCPFVGYFAVEAIDEADLPAEVTKYTITFDKGKGDGVAPAAIEVEKGQSFTAPKNYTIFADNKTLTGWTPNETDVYVIGQEITPEGDMTLTAVFTGNDVELADRTEEVTISFVLDGTQGKYNINNSDFIVTQATVEGKTIDVKADITDGSLVTNNDWHKVDNGFNISIPSAKGATVVINTYNDPTNLLTFGGSPSFEVSGADHNWTATYTATDDASTLNIAQSGLNYWKSLVITLPVVESDEPSGDDNVVYLWTPKKENGGKAVAGGGSDSESDITDSYIRLKGKKDFSTNVITITLDNALMSGDEIAITAYRDKNEADKKSGALLKFEKGSTNVSTATNGGLEFVNINSAVSGTDEYGTEPNTVTLTVPEDAEGSKTITMTRAETATNLFITKLVITRPTSDEPGVEPEVVNYDNVIATWDFANNCAELDTKANGGAYTNETMASDVDDVDLTIVYNGGQIKNNDNSYLLSNGVKLQVPVKTNKDIITVIGYPGYTGYTIGTDEGTGSSPDVTHRVTSAEAELGYAILTAGNNCYIKSITVEQNSGYEEKMLFSTDFSDWNTIGASTSKTTVKKTTKYTNEALDFDIYNTAVLNVTDTKFSAYLPHIALQAAKAADPYVTTSKLASITKVRFIHGATGGDRGWKLEAKGDGDDDWVVISDATANPAAWSEVVANVNRQNVQLRWTNLTNNQNAYMFELDIYGMVDMSSAPILGTFKANDLEYVAGDIFEQNNDGDYEATIELSKTETMISETNPLSDIVADNGQVGTVTYQTTGEGSSQTTVATIPVTVKGETANYIATFKYKADYTLTYYAQDGTTVIGTQIVEKDAAIGQFAYGATDITVGEGMKFRGWGANTQTSDNRKFAADDVITANTSLYAIVTKIETESSSARYDFNLNDQYFYAEDHEAFNPEGSGKWHDAQHGWVFSVGDKIDILVGGNANIILGCCAYSGGSAITLTNSGGETVGTITNDKASSDGQKLLIEYKGEAGTLTITFGGTSYVHNLTIMNVTDPTFEADGDWFIVEAGDANSLLNAIDVANAANGAADASRKYIFLPNGTYNLGTTCLTQISGNNISIIGESQEGVTIKNSPTAEGIGVTATLFITGKETYLQDMTIQNAWDYYGGIDSGAGAGRAVCIQDKGTNTICKNVTLLSYQDTYYTNNVDGNFYWETSDIHGTVDFICGEGTLFMENSTLTVEKRNSNGKGGCTLTAPSTKAGNSYGYVFSNCTILNFAENYNFGRAWNNEPRCAYINTTVNDKKLVDSRWTAQGMNNGVYGKKFVEYNTMDSNGNVVSPSSKSIKFYDKANAVSETYETILTAGQAADYTVSKVFTNWTPATYAAQLDAPAATYTDSQVSWTPANNGAIAYLIEKNSEFVGVTTESTFAVETGADDVLTIRAANGRGGFGEPTIVQMQDGVVTVKLNANGLATLASDKALDFTTGVDDLKAYIVKSKSETQATLTSVDATPAATGLVLKGTANATYNIPVATTAPAAIEGNLLEAAVTPTSVTASSVYVLSGSKFMLFDGTEIPAGKAYLPKSGVGARLLEFVFGDATAIGSVNIDVNVNQIYDLQGRRVKTPSKGVYVVDGKKVIIK